MRRWIPRQWPFPRILDTHATSRPRKPISYILLDGCPRSFALPERGRTTTTPRIQELRPRPGQGNEKTGQEKNGQYPFLCTARDLREEKRVQEKGVGERGQRRKGSVSFSCNARDLSGTLFRTSLLAPPLPTTPPGGHRPGREGQCPGPRRSGHYLRSGPRAEKERIEALSARTSRLCTQGRRRNHTDPIF